MRFAIIIYSENISLMAIIWDGNYMYILFKVQKYLKVISQG